MNTLESKPSMELDLSRRYIEQTADLIGPKTLVEYFQKQIKHASQIVYSWKSTGFNPFYKTRECLIRIWKCGDRELVKSIIRFFCEPFNLLPVAIPKHQPGQTPREMIQLACAEMDACQRVLREITDAVDERGDMGAEISPEEKSRIAKACLDCIGMNMELKMFVKNLCP